MEQEVQTFQQPPALDHEENPELGGSLQLGGEPEERQSLSQPQSAIQPPGQDGLLDQRFQFGGVSSPGISERGLTPQQHQHMLLQSMKSNGQGSYMNQQTPFQQQSNPPGHHRNASRYSFANESSSSTTVKPVASAKLLNQQSAIMPQNGGNHFGAQHQQHGSQFYTSNVQGPPPGLKTTGTPPVSGGMTFGQGHGFATGGIQYGANASGRSANEEMMRDLLRGRGSGADTAKRELHNYTNYSTSHSPAAYPTAGSQANAYPPGPGSYASLSSFSGTEDSKQRKKKNKKHRHANTSSSGGGLMDGADPTNHMLQSRFSQGAGNAYGGQAAGANAAGGLYSTMHGGGGYGSRW